MLPRAILFHAAMIGVMLCGWLFYESFRNNQDNLQLMQRQERIYLLREERDLARGSVQEKQQRIDNATRLANSVGPAILADLAAIAASGQNPSLTMLLKSHGIGGPTVEPFGSSDTRR